MSQEDKKESTSRYEHWERMIFPRWVFYPENARFRRRVITGYYSALFAIAIILIYDTLLFIQHRNILAFVDLVAAVALVCDLIYFRMTEGPYNYSIQIGIAIFGCFCVYLCFFGEASNPTYLWAYTYPLAAMFLLGSRQGSIAVTLFLISVTILLTFDQYVPYVVHFPLNIKLLLVLSLFTVSVLSYLFEKNREKANWRMKMALIELKKSKDEIELQIQERTSELAQSKEKYRAIIENMQEGYIEVDLKGRLTFFNKSAQEFLGYSKEETMGMHYKQYADKESSQKIFNLFNEVYRTHIPHAWFEWEVIRKDRARRTVEGSASLISDAEGLPVGFRGLFRDITDRKHLQEEHEQLQERLQRAEKMEALGMLAGGVAHDLNNVLGIVIGYAELLHDRVTEASPIRQHVMNIMDGGEKAAAIVQDLLTLARRGVQTRKVINLNTTIIDYKKSPEFVKLSSSYPNVQIITTLEADLLNITGSPVHLSKTIMNLVTNAMEAMPGSGFLTIGTSNRYLDRPVQGYDEVREGDYVVLSVSDTGEGIPAGDLKRIFEPFYTKKFMGKSGTGLGLAVVWGTVKDHNGYVNVESKEGKGTTFTLYFPVTREVISEDQVRVSVSQYMGNGESILVVDDIAGQRELASQMLNKLNYHVATVASGEEAVEYMKEHKADLIVLDMIMDPGMDGFDTYKKILEIHPNQKAIIVSGFSETDRVNEAHVLGAGAYVKKPYVLERLGLAVRQELDK